MDKVLILIKRYGPYVVIYILLLFIGHQCTKSEPEVATIIQKEEQAITVNQVMINGLIAKEKQLIAKAKRDSASSAAREIAYKHEISQLKKHRDQLRVDDQPALDTLPRIAELVAIQDTIINVQARRIDSLNVEKIRIKNDFDVRIEVKEYEFKASTEMSQHLKETADHYRKENKKLKRQNTWLKVGIVAVAIIAIFKE